MNRQMKQLILNKFNTESIFLKEAFQGESFKIAFIRIMVNS